MGEINPKTLAIDVATAYVTKGKGIIATVGTNAFSGGLNAYLTETSVLDSAISSGIGSGVGYGIGKFIEYPLDKRLNPDIKFTSTMEDFWKPYQKSYLPSAIGGISGEINNRVIQNELNKLEEKK